MVKTWTNEQIEKALREQRHELEILIDIANERQAELRKLSDATTQEINYLSKAHLRTSVLEAQFEKQTRLQTWDGSK